MSVSGGGEGGLEGGGCVVWRMGTRRRRDGGVGIESKGLTGLR